ncbi:MAG: ATP-binding protein [Desulfuromonadales bacterium]
MRFIRLTIIFSILITVLASYGHGDGSVVDGNHTIVRLGLEQDMPLAFINKNGNPSGIMAAAIFFAILLTFITTTLVLRVTVRRRTVELEQEIEVHKQTAKSLEKSEKELRNILVVNEDLKKSLSGILDTLPSIIARIDRDGRVDLVNRRFEQFSGVSAAAARGMLLESLIPHFTPQLQQVSEVIDRRTPVSCERIQQRSGKELSFFSLQIYPLNEEESGMAVIRIDDITEHVRIEEMIYRTEKMTMIGGLAAGMAHEINNPLGAIMQHSQNIERRVSPSISANVKAAEEVGVSLNLVRAYMEKREIFQFISHIRTAGERASTIISNMLHYSRRSESRTETARLSDVLNRVLELAATDYDMKKSYDFRRIELVRDFAADMPPVNMTVLEMEQVFLIILKNSAQAMTGAGHGRTPCITLRTRTDNGMAAIDIEDNGPGMDEATRLRIFEPFFSTREVGEGSGLGLSVAYAIVTKGHHGTIEAWSQQGDGCRFTIRIPMYGRA